MVGKDAEESAPRSAKKKADGPDVVPRSAADARSRVNLTAYDDPSIPMAPEPELADDADPAEKSESPFPREVPQGDVGNMMENAGDRRFSLAELEQIASNNNPSLRQATASAHKSMGFRDQVGLYPNPTVGYAGSQLFDAQTDQHTAFVNQEIVTGNKLELNRSVLTQDVQVQLWELDTQRRRVATDVRQRFYEALGAQRRLELAREFTSILERAAELTRQRQQAGDASVPEVLQTEIQLNQVQLSQRQASIAFEGAWKQLVAVVGMPDLPVSGLEGELPTEGPARDWEEAYQQLLVSSPELRAAEARVHRARANWERQEAQPIPNIQVSVAAGRDTATRTGLLNTQVGIPLPIWNRNEGNTYAAYGEFCRATQDVERRKLSIRSRLAAASRDFDSAAAGVARYRDDILPRAQQTLDLSNDAYNAGQIDFLQVLIARRTYFEANLSYVQAQTELAAAAALLDGLLLSGGLDEAPDTAADDGLRGQSFGGQQ
jgi:cobalt-zinc-cadmium efflux system outer membrane protein